MSIFAKIIPNFSFGSKRNASSYSSPAPRSGAPWKPLANDYFDGNKSTIGMRYPKNVVPDFNTLRQRAYNAELEQDAIGTITERFFIWVVGKGLKLQSEPDRHIINEQARQFDLKKFRDCVESRFAIFCNNTISDYSGMVDLHEQAKNAFRMSFLGDSLIVCRIIKGKLKVQIIDGEFVVSPSKSHSLTAEANARGNTIQHGVETNSKGFHVAYYVVNKNVNGINEVKRIEAYDEKTGFTLAWMFCLKKHKTSHVRGIPSISRILDKADKLDRYTEAIVSGAEERAKIAFAITHNEHSTGEDILQNKVAKVMGRRVKDQATEAEPTSFELSEATGERIAETSGKSVFNMPIGAKLESLSSDQEVNYTEFFDGVFGQISASANVPPEVAKQMYSSNYSASRAAITGWGHIVDVYRDLLSKNFYIPIYQLYLYCESIAGRIQCPLYLESINNDDDYLRLAITKCRLTGVNMPHIDPLKEIKAFREMLGQKNKDIPLTTAEKVAEQLGQGDFYENIQNHKEEVDYLKDNLNMVIDQNSGVPRGTESEV